MNFGQNFKLINLRFLLKQVRHKLNICSHIKNSRYVAQNLAQQHQQQQQQKKKVEKEAVVGAQTTQATEIGATTHFGYQTVTESEKEKKVHKVFEDVAKSYDLMNDAMSIGVHRIWKDIFMERLGPTHGTRLLDMAGGTGDIAFRFLKYVANKPNPKMKESHVTISDINQYMLDIGQERAKKLNINVKQLKYINIEWQCADAEKLPFDDNSFTAYTIAFGIRNCTHIDRVLREAHRVLKPGGRFMCLEFSHLNNEPLQWLYDQYSFEVIPPMGQILAGQWQPYQYLVESIRKFPKQKEFKEMIEKAGFNFVQYEDLTFGVVAIHSGFKL